MYSSHVVGVTSVCSCLFTFGTANGMVIFFSVVLMSIGTALLGRVVMVVDGSVLNALGVLLRSGSWQFSVVPSLIRSVGGCRM